MSQSERTKARLQETALALFTKRGFDEVTVEEIAATAGMSHMTFYRHFPTKESVVLDDPYDPMIGIAVAAQPASLTPIERARLGLLEILSQMDDTDDEAVLARVRLVADNSSLRARIWENNQRTEEVIVEALTESGTSAAEAYVAAGAVLGATTAALINWAQEDAPVSLARCLTRALDQLATTPT